MSIRRVASHLSFALVACGSLAVEAQKPACSTGIVQTSSGPVCGTTSTASFPEKGLLTTSAYLGIPYAVPPIGPRRWQYSTPFKGSDLLQATVYGNVCPQSLASPASTGSGSQCKDGRALGPGESEDCLYLNVWVPGGTAAGSQLPVMVFIHGGNFDQGSGDAGMPIGNLYDGTYLAATGKVIVVTFNYRLGALGFLARGGNYNFGFADQLLALNWVRTNIARFGGNPDNVTLFGQSAGAKSVGLHALSSPRSAGLFQAAIMESNALGLHYKSTSQTRTLSNAFCASGSSLCTTATTACDLVEAQHDFLAAQPLSFASLTNLMWAPTVDNVYVTGQPIASAANLGVPLVLGTNHDEGISFVYQAEQRAPKSIDHNPPSSAAYAAILDQQFGVANSRYIRSLERYDCGAASDCSNQLVNVITDYAFTCANRHLAIQATQGADPPPLYLYQFNQVSSFNFWSQEPNLVPQCAEKVCHADELPYVFNSARQFGKLGISFTSQEESLAQTLGGYWTSFANRHDPDSTWPLFMPQKTYRMLAAGSSTAIDPLDACANCSTLWDLIGYGTAPAEPSPVPAAKDFILYGGDVVTLDPAGTVAEAVWVRNGRIEAVGTREEMMRHATKATELIDLHGGALLPGFIDPHLHLDLIALLASYTDLSPCLPARYQMHQPCPLTIYDALDTLKKNPQKPQPPAGTTWFLGNGIDPSLMSLDGIQSGRLFQNNPAPFLERRVSKTEPVIILDKSAHLAYANRQAFVAAGICETVDNCSPQTAKKPLPQPPGQWAVDESGFFNGLLVEQQAFVAFTAVTPQPTEEEAIHSAEASSRDFSRAGVTTVVNGGTQFMPSLLPQLAWRSRAHPLLRYRALVPPTMVSPCLAKPSRWEEYDGLFGVTGIKLWADGSAQGCTAALVDPYDQNGSCDGAGQGIVDLCTDQIVTTLASPWKAGWPIQIHVNGDRAIQIVLEALATLQAEARNDSPITLLHFTVDGNTETGEDMVQQVADLRAGRFVYNGKPAPRVDVRVSHLIGHVAYWGGALQNILDGASGPEPPHQEGRAARIDATRRDLELGVPFSLHSDASVTPVHPLWYVEQAVTRNTWFYPKLSNADVHTMPGGQNVTIEQALRAVTLEPARQHGLDRYIGSIEKGKIADLVILDKNPLRQPPNEIHLIRVLSTFVSGYRNDGSKQ